MATIDVVDSKGSKTGTIDVSDAVFNAEINKKTVRISLNQYLANQRQGTAATKTKGLVRGGGKKPWRQKGTGRARAGSNRSPLWRKGGTIFGPQPRDYLYKVNKKVKQNAMRSAITSLTQEGKLLVVDQLDFSEPKTKLAAEFLKNLNVDGKAVVLIDTPSENVILSFKNLPYAKLLRTENINIFDLLNCDTLVTTSTTIKKVEDMLK